ncbi:MAG: hypothetical protein HYU88_10735 [Chloroflexi bacterium]|nr:hypothetical protein [Chloroflexota bacterium]
MAHQHPKRVRRPWRSPSAVRWLAAALALALSVLALRAVLESELRDASRTWVNRGLARGAVVALHWHDGALDAATTNGVFRTADGGATWQSLLAVPSERRVQGAAFGAGSPPAIALGTAAGLLLSVDGGATWREALPAEQHAAVFGVGLGPGERVYAAQEGAALTSADGGARWRSARDGVPALPFLAFSPEPTAPERILAGGDGGLFVSADGGGTWRPVPAWPADAQVRTIVRRASDPAHVYVGASGLGAGGLYASRDGGATWQPLGRDTLFSDHVSVVLDAGDAQYVGTRGVADTDTVGGVWASRDGGRTWAQVKTKLSNTDVISLALEPGPPRALYAGTEGGVVFRYTLDAWWVGLVPWLPALSLVEPLALGVTLTLLVVAFAGLRRRAPAARAG